jgi:hypothetical protein
VREHDSCEWDLTDTAVVKATPFTEELKINDESAKKCPETVKQTWLDSHAEEVSMGVAGRNNRKIGSGYSDANTTHSTLGDKNFVQNYFKVSSGQNRAFESSFSQLKIMIWN